MERHHCKLCPRSFINGKALGGHMRTHLALLPIPPKQQLSKFGDDHTESRENPKKSFKVGGPEFLESGSVVLDRESESNSTKDPTRKRFERTRRTEPDAEEVEKDNHHHTLQQKRQKPNSIDSVNELETVSSVSDTTLSVEDEDCALGLMMLSRDKWGGHLKQPSLSKKIYQCETCNRVFKSSQGLGGHRASHKKYKAWSELDREIESLELKPRKKSCSDKKNEGQQQQNLHDQCLPIRFKIYGSGQKLVGHQKSHFLFSSSTAATTSASTSLIYENVVTEKKSSGGNDGDGDGGGGGGGGLKLIDLNLPATLKNEDFSQFS